MMMAAHVLRVDGQHESKKKNRSTQESDRIHDCFLCSPELRMKESAAKITLPILIALTIAVQKTVAIRLLVKGAAAQSSAISVAAFAIEMRSLWIVSLPAAPVVRSCKQAVMISLIVS